jgi:hypothetical protein
MKQSKPPVYLSFLVLCLATFRICLRRVLEPVTRAVLPEETITRAKYYLSICLSSKPNAEVIDAGKLRAEAQEHMQRQIRADPPDRDIAKLDDAVLYDYLVAAGLRIFIIHTEPAAMDVPISPIKPYARFLAQVPYQIEPTPRSLQNLAPRMEQSGRAESTTSIAQTLPDVDAFAKVFADFPRFSPTDAFDSSRLDSHHWESIPTI